MNLPRGEGTGPVVTSPISIVALNGSLRERSSNGALLRAVQRAAPAGVSVVLYDGIASIPHFNPDLDGEDAEPPARVRELRSLLIGASGIVISCPEYAHGVPGAFKNLLDWLVSVGELVEKPVALFNASAAGGQYAQAALLETLRTMNWRVVEEASLVEPFLRRKIAGELDDGDAEETLSAALKTFVNAILMSGAEGS
jgi:chromate reductase, NAD(P)H dehydrogenase (quinone)